MATINVRHKITENASGQAVGLSLNTGGAEVTLLTGGTGLVDPTGQASGYGGQLLSVLFSNSGTSARRVKLYLYASGDAVGEDVKLWDETIPPESTFLYQPRIPPKYRSGAVVKAMQTSGTDVFAKAEAVEFY